MSDLVDFEDLGDLDGGDLRAVLGQVEQGQLLDALGGLSAERRRIILAKLPPAAIRDLETQIAAREPASAETVRAAQRVLVDALCRMSRNGQIAFDDPDDF